MKKVLILYLLLVGFAMQNFAQDFKSYEDYKRQIKEERKAKRDAEAAQYGDNMFRLIPLRILNVEGVGLGLDYERIVDKNRNVGIVIPITYFIGDSYYNFYGGERNKFSYIYFSPE